jgi:hypothetical protein
MKDERRFREDEVQEIFERAASKEARGLPAPVHEAGLTLSDLQDIGRQVGLEPSRIAEAATALDTRPEVLSRRTVWGVPVAVGQIVELDRAPTDREWEMLVAEIRRTFGARGRLTEAGGLREWSNGNLHVYVEPTETGHRLRMGTLKGNAASVTAMGVVGLGMGMVFLISLLADGKLAKGLFLPVMFMLMGGGALVSNLLGLPRWAREREEQMQHIAARATALIGTEPKAPDSAR